MISPQDKLIQLYQQIADLTKIECQQCRVPLSCCSPEYCNMAIEWAKEKYQIELVPTNHAKLPLMGENGCTVAPHLRPLCSVHTCRLNILRGDAWEQQYFALRTQIEQLEYQLHFDGEMDVDTRTSH